MRGIGGGEGRGNITNYFYNGGEQGKVKVAKNKDGHYFFLIMISYIPRKARLFGDA